MAWAVTFHDSFEEEFADLVEEIQDELLAMAKLLQQYGPRLSRPYADTLKGSRFPNMKELRFAAADGQWRTAFAFDPNRVAIILATGDKSGVGQSKFYNRLIAKADKRYQAHLDQLKAEQQNSAKAGKKGRQHGT